MLYGDVYRRIRSNIKNMFSFSKKKKEQISFKIQGMHCVSCAMNIDGALEDVDGVVSSRTSYAKQVTNVSFDPLKVDIKKIKSEIANQGYTVEN